MFEFKFVKIKRFANLLIGAALLVPAFGFAATPLACTVTGLSFNPGNITSGQTTNITWSTSGCAIVYLLDFGPNPPPSNSSLNFQQVAAMGKVLSTDKSSGSINSGPLTQNNYYAVLATSGGQATMFAKQIQVFAGAPQSGAPYNTVFADGTVYRVAGGKRYPYSSAAAFLSYGFNSWTTLVASTGTELALPLAQDSSGKTSFVLPRNGSLINDHGTIYIITNGKRQGFVSAQAFLGLGYSFKNVLPGDTSFMDTLPPITSPLIAHPQGTVVNDNGTFYLMQNTSKQGFSSFEIFNSWGVSVREVVRANVFDMTALAGSVMSARSADQLSF